MKKPLLTLIILITSFVAFSQSKQSKQRIDTYKKEIDSIAKIYNIKNACGLTRTVVDNGIRPLRESLIIIYKNNKGELEDRLLYTYELN